MMDAEERHWTHDSELIERFVLNRIDPEERNELEDHLRVCEVCKQAVRAEQIFTAGIHRSGRERFKAKLKERLTSRSTHVPWPHILSAAAVAVIVVGVAFYNRWFDFITQTDIPGSAQIAQPVSPKAKKPEGSPTENSMQTPEKSQASASAPTSSEKKSLRVVEKEPRAANEQPAIPQPQAVVGAADELHEGVGISSLEPREIWIDGELIGPAQSPEAQPIEEHAPHELRREREDTHDRAATDGVREARQPIVIIEQRPIEALPASRRPLELPRHSAKLPTLLRTSGDTLLVILYSDEDLGNLGHALVKDLRNDTLVVSLADRRIRYRLPEGWLKK